MPGRRGRVFEQATDMLWNPLVGPALRAALHKVLAATPGVVVHAHARDTAGRPAVEISRLDTAVGVDDQTFENPATGAVLETAFSYPRDLAGARTWRGNVGRVTDPSDERSTPYLGGVRVLVTGGTSGLGFAMSQALAEAGARVALTGRTDRRVRDAADRIARRTPVTGVVIDVRDEQSVAAGVDYVRSALGGIDVLVNNAGIGMRTVNPDFMTSPQGFWHVSPDGFRDLFATNVLGYFLVARTVVPHMLTAGRGKIINISVSETTMRRKGFTPYGPSRAATDALSHIMAADLAGTGIDVNLLLPGGPTRSGMTPDSAQADQRVNWLDPVIMGPPVCWLASPAADGLADQRIVATEFAGRQPR